MAIAAVARLAAFEEQAGFADLTAKFRRLFERSLNGQTVGDWPEKLKQLIEESNGEADWLQEQLPAASDELMDSARWCLEEALERWHDLRDPDPTEDNNFKHPESGKEYNYCAAETHQVLVQFERGILTRYPLGRIHAMNESLTQTDRLSLFNDF